MRSVGIVVAIVTALVAVGFTGCGGGDDSSSTTTAAISKDDFVEFGNKICAEGNKTFDAAAKSTFSGGKPTEAEMTKFVDETAVPTIQGEIDGIRAIGAPEGDEDQVNAILDAAQQASTISADPTAFGRRQRGPVRRGQQASQRRPGSPNAPAAEKRNASDAGPETVRSWTGSLDRWR